MSTHGRPAVAGPTTQKKGGARGEVSPTPLRLRWPSWLVFGELSARAGPAQAQARRVVHTPVGDRGGPRGRVTHLAPVSNGPMRGHHRGLPLVPLADDLAEEGCTRLAQGTRPEFVTPTQVRGGGMRPLVQPRLIRRRRPPLSHQVHGGGKAPLHIGGAGRRGELAQQVVPGPGWPRSMPAPGAATPSRVTSVRRRVLCAFRDVWGSTSHGSSGRVAVRAAGRHRR
jgi:hypothetical protein